MSHLCECRWGKTRSCSAPLHFCRLLCPHLISLISLRTSLELSAVFYPLSFLPFPIPYNQISLLQKSIRCVFLLQDTLCLCHKELPMPVFPRFLCLDKLGNCFPRASLVFLYFILSLYCKVFGYIFCLAVDGSIGSRYSIFPEYLFVVNRGVHLPPAL